MTQSNHRPAWPGSAPDIRVSFKRAGLDSLEAIDQELASGRADSIPEIQISESPLGRETLQAIEEELRAPTPIIDFGTALRPEASSTEADTIELPPELAAAEVYEMLSFVVRARGLGQLASEMVRRKFVERHLLRRLPVSSLAEVVRTDTAPGPLPGTLVLRVWCRI